MPEVMQGAGQGLVKTNQPGDCTFLGLGLRAAGGWRKGWMWELCWSASRAIKALAVRTGAQLGLCQRPLSGGPRLPCGRCRVGLGARMAHALCWPLWGQQDTGLLLSLWGKGRLT